MIIIALLMALLDLLTALLFGDATYVSVEKPAQTPCAATAEPSPHCPPIIHDGGYLIPTSGPVIEAIVNNGSLPPKYQMGYTITIDASGIATIEITAKGQRDHPRRSTVELSADDVQALLGEISRDGFFTLPTSDETSNAQLPVGGPASFLIVTLRDGKWDVNGTALSTADRAKLENAQKTLLRAVGLDPNDPIGQTVNATPAAE